MLMSSRKVGLRTIIILLAAIFVVSILPGIIFLLIGEEKQFRQTILIMLLLASGINALILFWLGSRLVDMRDSLARAQEELQASNAYLTYASGHDRLTNLANKDNLKSCFENLVYRNPQIRLALIFMDLDNFKSVNDVLGHNVGDILLNKVSNIIRKICSGAEIICRAGGDEFLILTRFTHMNDIGKLAKALLKAIGTPIDVSGTELHSTASMGASLYPFDSYDFQELYKNADTAMYEAKQEGKNKFRFFSPDMHRHRLSGYEILEKLHDPRKHVYFEYQPIIDLNASKICGFEALARMTIDGRAVSPAEFIPLAESHGLIFELGEHVLRQACCFLKQLNELEGCAESVVAVNISGMQLTDRDFLEKVDKVLSETGVNPRNVLFELTESVLVDGLQNGCLAELVDRGIRIGVDDFGAGYSSLSYFSKLPVSFLKIDRSFVKNIGVSAADENLVDIIIHIAAQFGLNVVAEGVESVEKLAFLKSKNCTCAQGFLFGMPLAGELILADNGKILTQVKKILKK